MDILQLHFGHFDAIRTITLNINGVVSIFYMRAQLTTKVDIDTAAASIVCVM